VPAVRIALAQVNATVGDLEGNAAIAREAVGRAAQAGAKLVLLPEMVLTGYPVEDLALRWSFISASRQCLEDLAVELDQTGLGHVSVLVGYLDGDRDAPQRLGMPRHSPRNAAAVLRSGRVHERYFKQHLPNYGVFDENRYFVPGTDPLLVRVAGLEVAVVICEDLWQDDGPLDQLAPGEADLVAVLNGSPYERDKDDVRLEMCQRRARQTGSALAYVNLVGGQDELVFDGDSMVVDRDGGLVARARHMAEDLLVVDLPASATDTEDSRASDGHTSGGAPVPGRVEPRLGELEEVYEALVLGVRDYVGKNGFRSVVLGLSGGIDSALTAAIAVDALGPGNVVGVALPSAFSSAHSVEDAAALADATGLRYRVVPIAPTVELLQETLHLAGVAAENLQARIRGVILMALSNQEGHLVLATGNKSEISVGYSTIYGDAVGGFAPIKDVPKRLVWELARDRNRRASATGDRPPIPERSIEKPPSAELRPGQLDSDSLPDYQLLDSILDDYVERDLGSADLVGKGFAPGTVQDVLQLTDRAEYKRRQYPPGPKVTARNFGRDRRLPMTNRWREPVVE
jgi:NAD+ synthase (glutamine-hydrolysing)